MGGHFTQVVWRATHYVGCGVASGSCGHIQVCRYIKPGNCNGKDNFMRDETPCSPDCPPEGCFDVVAGGESGGGSPAPGLGNPASSGSASSDSTTTARSEEGDPGCSSFSDSSAGCQKSEYDSASSDSSAIMATPATLMPLPPPPSPGRPPSPAPPKQSSEANWSRISGGAEVFEAGEAFDLEHSTLRFAAKRVLGLPYQ